VKDPGDIHGGSGETDTQEVQGRIQAQDPPGNRSVQARRRWGSTATGRLVLFPTGHLTAGTGDRPDAGARSAPAGTQTTPSGS
jgi:hypothetical protein